MRKMRYFKWGTMSSQGKVKIISKNKKYKFKFACK